MVKYGRENVTAVGGTALITFAGVNFVGTNYTVIASLVVNASSATLIRATPSSATQFQIQLSADVTVDVGYFLVGDPV